MELQEFLQTKLLAQLTPIKHESLNNTFFGVRQKDHQKIFVKVFTQKGKFLTEKAVNEQLNSRVLDTLEIKLPEKLFVLVMTDIAPTDITCQLSPELAEKMGEKLADFHEHVQPFAGIYRNNELLAKAEYDIGTFSKLSMKKRMLHLLTLFKEEEAELSKNLQAHSKTVLHGDVGVRNYQIVNGELALIDFERARMGVNYQDFIKLFYQDFRLAPDLIAAFLHGYQSSGLQVEISQLTQVFLIFITAIGIVRYTEKITDPDFEKVGLKMLETVEQFLNNNKNWSGSESTKETNLLNALIK